MFSRVSRWLQRIPFKQIEFACAASLLVAIVVIVIISAISRKMGSPIIWSIEVPLALFVWMVAFAADLALQEQRHFGLALILDNVPERVKRWIEIGNMLIVMALLVYLLKFAITNVELMHQRMFGAVRLPKSYIHAAIPFAIVLMLRTFAVQLYTKIRAT